MSDPVEQSVQITKAQRAFLATLEAESRQAQERLNIALTALIGHDGPSRVTMIEADRIVFTV